METIQESDIIRAAQQGDLDAFNQLVLLYQEMAFNVAYRLLTDEDLAEDVTQKAIISAYRNLSGYRGGSFRSWLLRIVTNACYDELRRIKRYPTIPLEPIVNEEESFDSPHWLADDAQGPEELLSQHELDKAVQHCLNDLSVDFKSVVIMVDIEDMDYQEVAGTLGKPLGTVKSRLARARLQMRECLQQFWELLPQKYRLEKGGA